MMRVVGAEDQDCERFEIRMVREWEDYYYYYYYFFPERMGFDNSTLTRWNLERGGARLWGAFIGMASIFFKICLGVSVRAFRWEDRIIAIFLVRVVCTCVAK